MNTVVFKNKMLQEALTVTTFSGLCLILLALRIKLSHDFFLIFMGWNLFLALIPYGMTWLIRLKSSSLIRIPLWIRRIFLSGFIAVWLLFLPNAPYMITDSKHLQMSSTFLWIDSLLLSSFAIAGVILLYRSLEHFLDLFSIFINSSKAKALISHIIFSVCSFGVYLGRSLRYNSWDILTDPMPLFQDIAYLLVNPQHHGKFWLQVIFLSIALSLGYFAYRKISRR